MERLGDETLRSFSPEQQLRYDSHRLEAAKAAVPYIHPRLSPIDKPVHIDTLSGGLADQARAILVALCDGSITPDQASTLMRTIATQARIIEVDQLEKRVAALEQRQPEKQGG